MSQSGNKVSIRLPAYVYLEYIEKDINKDTKEYIIKMFNTFTHCYAKFDKEEEYKLTKSAALSIKRRIGKKLEIITVNLKVGYLKI